MIEQGLQGGTPFNQQLLTSIIELLLIVAILWIIRTIFRIVTKIIKGIWNLLFGRRKKALESDDWLTRAQAKQEIRFQNSMPPLQANQKTQKKRKQLFKRKGEGENWYPTGWTLNEKTGLWEPPGYMKSDTSSDQAKPQADQPDSSYHYVKKDLAKEEFSPGSIPKQNSEEKPQQKAPMGPQTIYTYAKPELKTEDKEETSTELDFKTAYQRKELFTRNEWQNYKKLRDIAEVRGYVICPKVRLFDLVEPRHDKKKKLTYRYKIQAKHVDFVICDKDMSIKAILELDDSSHYDPERIKRDDFVNTILLSTGYTVIHTKYVDNSVLDLI